MQGTSTSTWLRRMVVGLLGGLMLSSAAVSGTAEARPTAPLPERPLASALQTSPGATYVPVTPTRIADTRRPFGSSIPGKIPAGATTTIKITGRSEIAVPANATAVVLNVTADQTGGPGFATIFPTGTTLPDASNLNYTSAGYTGANLATVRIGANGSINVYTYASTHLIVDIFGYYVPAPGAVSAGRVEPYGPERLYDSRASGGMSPWQYRTIQLDRVPTGATAVVLNYTVTNTHNGGYFSILPPSSQPASGEPATSNVNVTASGATVANQVMLPIGTDKRVTLFTTAGGDVILDIFGFVTGTAAPITTRGLFVPLNSPYRMLDTRSSSNNPLGPGYRLWQGWTVEVPVAGRGGVPTTGVGAIVGNTTYVDAHGWGWLADYPAGTPFPGTSTVNSYYGGQTVPNHTLTPISARGVAIYAGDAGGHALLDVSGYYLGTPLTGNVPAGNNVPPPPNFPLKLTIPSIGHESWIQETVTDSALANGPGWWPGSAYPGVAGNFVVFGHRTEHGGPFRYINGLSVGDQIIVEGDHRRAVYVVNQHWFVIGAGQAPNYVGPSGPNQITLIACTQPNGQPTSTSYRIIVTATLVSYTND